MAQQVHTTANLGAYLLSTFSTSVSTILCATLLAGQHEPPKIWCAVDAMFTNAAPVDLRRWWPTGWASRWTTSVEHGETAKVLFGMGTYGSRSPVGGTAVVRAADKIIAEDKKIAAHLLQAADTDIVF